jgi:tetratricopeptide (TPR) repeat protein
MTPEFASPEQVTGQPITTSSDVYSLGVLLYRLVAGKHPYEMNTNSAAEVERAICETNPERPSVIARTGRARAEKARPEKALTRADSADLDNIVLMAMRKEPQRRYASAEHLSEDIRRYLADLPITARKDTLFYRAAKFTRRHRLAVVAATLASVVLIAVGVYAVTETVRAAEAKGKAAEHLALLLHSQRFMLFDLDEKLKQSVTLGRKALATEATAEIQALAEKSGGDQDLLFEAAKGYHKIGDDQGNPSEANLGQYDQARQSYEKMLQVGQSMKPGKQSQLVIGTAEMCLGRLDAFLGIRASAESHFQAAMKLFQSSGSKNGIMLVWEQRGQMAQGRGDIEEARQDYAKSRQYATELATRNPTPGSRSNLIVESLLYGLALGRGGHTDESLDTLRHALALAQKLAAADPSRRRQVYWATANIAYVLHRTGRNAEAIELYKQAVQFFQKALRDDLENRQARVDLGQMKGELAEAFWDANLKADAAAATAGAIDVLEPVMDRDDDAVVYFLQQYAAFLLAPSNAHPNPALALKCVRRAAEAERHSNPETLETLAAAFAATGDRAQAQETGRQALALLPAGADELLRKKLERWSGPSKTPQR